MPFPLVIRKGHDNQEHNARPYEKVSRVRLRSKSEHPRKGDKTDSYKRLDDTVDRKRNQFHDSQRICCSERSYELRSRHYIGEHCWSCGKAEQRRRCENSYLGHAVRQAGTLY